MTAGATAGTARILDVAKVPTEPLGPRRFLGAIAGMLSGLFAGCLFVVAKAKLDHTIKRPGDARRALGLRELGAMPDAAFEQERVRMTPAGVAAKEPTRAEKAYIDDRPSGLAECVRGIRTSLLLGPESPHVITITSPTAGDGKTTVAANLAAALAESNGRTLILDADLRRPRLHEVFEVSNSQGLVDLLADCYLNPLDFAVQVSQDLWFLPAGVAAFGGPGLLHEAATQELLERLKRQFDVIIVDAPPVLAVSDARALSSVADGTILVVRAGVTEPDDAIEAKTLLEEDGAHLLGVVLNSWNPRVYGPREYERYGANYQSSEAA
jgi:tyrosine-protein kinase Etk/Wzc